MQPVPYETLIANLSWRYAVKKFDATKKIPAATWQTLEQTLRLAPSSYGIQPWRFVVVTNPEVRTKLRAVSWNQPQITDASHLVVFCRRIEVTAADIDAYVADIAQTRGVTLESLKDYRAMMVGSVSNPATLPGGGMEIWSRSQVYISLGFFLAAAALAGVDACPMEGFDPNGYDTILNTSKDGYMPVVLAAAGYRSAEDKMASAKKVRFATDTVVKHV